MNRIATFTLATALLIPLGIGEAISQPVGPGLHRYLVRAVLTAEGIKNLRKQPPTALKAGVAKFVESVGGKLEFWFFDFGSTTAYSVIDYPDEIAAATAQLSTNSAGFAHSGLAVDLAYPQNILRAIFKSAPPPSPTRPPSDLTARVSV
jgi:uncharacterized protein with GYD domain